MLKPIGVNLPVYPVKGYSVTLPVTDDAFAPQSTIMDETHKVAITRLGDRIRVAGTAEIAGNSNPPRPHSDQTSEHVDRLDLFPKGGDISKAEWAWTEPPSDDAHGTPVYGPSRYDNLYLKQPATARSLDHGLRLGPRGGGCGAGQGAGDLVRGPYGNRERYMGEATCVSSAASGRT